MKLTVLLLILSAQPVVAHSGRTDKHGCHSGEYQRHSHKNGKRIPCSPAPSSTNETTPLPFKSERYEYKDESPIPEPEPKPKPKRLPPLPPLPHPKIDAVGLLIKIAVVIVVVWLTTMLFTRKKTKIKPKRTKCRQLFNKVKYWLLRSKKRHFK